MLIPFCASPDYSLLSAIHSSCFDRGWNREEFNGLFAIGGTLAFIAPQNNGFGILRITGDEAEVITLAVLPHCRREGIGKTLVSSMLAYAAERGVTAVFLEVREDNEVAKALYAALGFAIISRRKHYYRNSNGSETDAIVMRKTL